MRKKANIVGFTLIEMLVTMTIMLIFGSVGTMQISQLKNYFTVTGAQEKLQSAMQNTKKDVLEGLALCANITVYAQNQDQTTDDQALFFTSEEWTPPQGLCVQDATTNALKSITTEINPTEGAVLKLSLNDSFSEVFTQVFDQNLQEIAAPKKVESHSLSFPLTGADSYIVKIYDATQATTLSSIDISFYNANKTSIENTDPSIIRVSSISGTSVSQETKNGNLSILFESPYGKSRVALFFVDSADPDKRIEYLAKNIKISFSNKNEAEGNYSFFNASLLGANAKKTPAINKRTTCVFDTNSIEFTCINSHNE